MFNFVPVQLAPHWWVGWANTYLKALLDVIYQTQTALLILLTGGEGSSLE